jgi:phosphotriesterase-related protein
MPGLEYLPRRFIPRLIEAGGESLVHHILDVNPARLLTLGFDKAAT